MNRIKLLVLISTVGFLSIVRPAQGDGLTVGWEPWPPYMYVDRSGQLTGLDIELIDAILSNMDHEHIWVNEPWQRLLKNVEFGKRHMAPTASKAAERKVYAHFSNPYRSEQIVLYVKAESKDEYDIRSLSDIAGTDFTIAANIGYYYGEEFEALMRNPEFRKNVILIKSDMSGRLHLKNNRVDGFLADPIAVTTELGGESTPQNLAVKLTLYTDGIHVMFSKKLVPEDTVDAFNKSLEELQKRGTISMIMDRYIHSKKPYAVTSNLD